MMNARPSEKSFLATTHHARLPEKRHRPPASSLRRDGLACLVCVTYQTEDRRWSEPARLQYCMAVFFKKSEGKNPAHLVLCCLGERKHT